MSHTLFKLLVPAFAVACLCVHAESAKELSDRIDAASHKAADFILKQQQEDGTFSTAKGSKMPGVSALAVRALAACGDDYRDVRNPAVAKAVAYILSCQNTNGSIYQKDFGAENLNTSVAVAALAALHNPAHRAVVEKAKDYLLSCQMTEEKLADDDHENPKLGSFGEGKDSNYNLMGTAFSLEAFREAGMDTTSLSWRKAAGLCAPVSGRRGNQQHAVDAGRREQRRIRLLPRLQRVWQIHDKERQERAETVWHDDVSGRQKSAVLRCGKRRSALQSAYRWMKNNYDVTTCPGANRSQGYYFYAMSFSKAFTRQRHVVIFFG